MGSRADGTNPRALGTNPRAISARERFPETPIKPRTREKWYAGKRYVDDHIEVVFAKWEDCKHLFQHHNHSHVRGFWREVDAREWVESLPQYSRCAEAPANWSITK